jgi:dihydrodipicolinate synthase/N-acetylneuraminate lyase
MIQGGGLGAFKAAARLVGHDLGGVRGPLRTLSPAEEATLFSELERAGFQELAAM